MRSFFLLFGLITFSVEALAVEVEYFNFTNSKTYALTDDALLGNSLINNDYPWMLTAAYDYVKTPLTIKDQDERTDDIIKSLQGLHLGGGYRLTQSLFIGAKTYVAKLAGEADGMYWGDSKLEAKWRFWEGSHSALALIPTVYVPTGTNGFTRNNRKVGESLNLVFEHNFEWVQISLMGGFVNKPGATFDIGSGFTALNYKQSIYTAIGAIVPFTDEWAMNIEAYRYNQLKGNQHPNEVYFGVRNQTTASLSSFLGLSLGGVVDETSNDYRISAGIKFTPFEEVVKEQPKPKPAPAPGPVAPPKKVTRDEGLKKEKALYGKLMAVETIYFANGSSKLDKFSKDIVQKFKNALLKFKTGHTIVLEGFASKVGDPVSNMKLSRNRIEATQAELIALRVNPKVMVEVAYGDSAADMTVSEALNRKVMMRLYKKEQ